MKHREIEVKYLINQAASREQFLAQLSLLPGFQQAKRVNAQSHDLYMVVPQALPCIYRFRHDPGLQQLCMKSLGDSFPVRQEITLHLDREHLQKDEVLAIFSSLGMIWQGELTKDLTAYTFSDCEMVIYRAAMGGATIECIEIEALAARDIVEGLATISRYQRLLGLEHYAQESKASLFRLLVYPQLPPEVRQEIDRKLP